jgi:hypothetical protein
MMLDTKRIYRRSGFGRLVGLATLVGLGSALLAAPAAADVYERAKRIHDRLVGVPPGDVRLQEIVDRMGAGQLEDDVVAAALYALEHPAFYSSTLKTWVTPWTNQEQTVFAPFNDYTALVIGMIRDDEPFNEVLSTDLIYVGRTSGTNAPASTGYSRDNNFHYEELHENRANLMDEGEFFAVSQSADLPNPRLGIVNTAGVITTRQAGKEFFSAGTNRRVWRYTAINYLCRDMEQMLDTSVPSDWIRQDISRSPGGDSTLFLNACIGCHSGMDPMTGAYAYFEWMEGDEDDPSDNGRLIHTPGAVQEKYVINANTFSFGYETGSDRWKNYWVVGKNALIGWPTSPTDGYGPKSLGEAVGNSEGFATCQVEKVFEQVCFRPDQSTDDRDAITRITQDFKDSNYSMKRVFAEVAEYCTRPDAN